MGKLCERILYVRIELITESPTDLQGQQYGFRKGKSTLDALTAVTDVALGIFQRSELASSAQWATRAYQDTYGVPRLEQAGPQPPLTSNCSPAVEVENLAPTASTNATSQKTIDHVTVPLPGVGVRFPAGSPHRPSDLPTAIQNEDLKCIFANMNGTIKNCHAHTF